MTLPAEKAPGPTGRGPGILDRSEIMRLSHGGESGGNSDGYRREMSGDESVFPDIRCAWRGGRFFAGLEL